MFFHITNRNGDIISSNLPDKLLKTYNPDKDFLKKETCSVKQKEKRHGLKKSEKGCVYVVSYDKSLTNKIFKRYIEACEFFLPGIIETYENNKFIEGQRTRRLKHNLVNYNTNTLQELYRLIPQESLVKGGKEQASVIKDIIASHPTETSYVILRILKNANLMKSEFDVHEMLTSENPYLEFYEHPIHKVIMLTLNSFWLDFIEKEVFIDIENFYEAVTIDYKSISVALCHILDNASKYIAPKTVVKIKFRSKRDTVETIFEMTSLKVEDSDIDEIFKEGVSGTWSKKLGKSGDGIGMHVIDKIIKLNKGVLQFNKNINSAEALSLNGIPFERNQIVVELNKKAVPNMGYLST